MKSITPISPPLIGGLSTLEIKSKHEQKEKEVWVSIGFNTSVPYWLRYKGGGNNTKFIIPEIRAETIAVFVLFTCFFKFLARR